MRRRRNTQHQHEWTPAYKEVAMVEGETLTLTETCEWVEITGTHTDYERDEVYYDTGAECDSTRRHKFEVSLDEHELFELNVGTYEQIVLAVEQYAEEEMLFMDTADSNSQQTTVEVDGIEYTVLLEKFRTTVSEGYK